MEIGDGRNDLAEALRKVTTAGERVIVQRRGKGVAALVSLEDLALLEKLEDEVDLKTAQAALRERGEFPWEKVKAELGLRGLERGQKRDVSAAKPVKTRRGGRVKA